MSPKSFWIIVVRLLGVWLLTDLLSLLQGIFAFVYFNATNQNGNFPPEEITRQIMIYGISMILVLIFIYITIFRAADVVRILRLDDGQQEESFQISINSSTALYLAIFIIGGLMIANTIPTLCTAIVGYYRVKQLVTQVDVNDLKNVVINLVKIIIGVLLVVYSKLIAKYINSNLQVEKDS